MRHWSVVLGTRALAVVGLVVGMALVAVPGDAQTRRAQHHHPHMQAALHELKEARHELKEARHDFGGHREKALKAVDHAIHELEEALHHRK
jgi:hypothetical protein